MVYKDRLEAGQLLADQLKNYKKCMGIIYALPRGGVVTAAAIAKKLHLPLDLIITRKIGHPHSPEYGIGAVAENGDLLLTAEAEEIDQKWLKGEIKKQIAEAKRRRRLYLGDKKPLVCQDKVAILVDDGLATGLTMEVAVEEIRKQKPAKIVIAVPVAPRDIAIKLGKKVDVFVSPQLPRFFSGAVGAYYESFPQVSDQEVIAILKTVA